MITYEILKNWLDKRQPTLLWELDEFSGCEWGGQRFILDQAFDANVKINIYTQPGILGDSTAPLPSLLEYLDHWLDDTPEQAAALDREHERKRSARQPGGLKPVHLSQPRGMIATNGTAIILTAAALLDDPHTAAVLRHYAPEAYHDLRVALGATYIEPPKGT